MCNVNNPWTGKKFIETYADDGELEIRCRWCDSDLVLVVDGPRDGDGNKFRCLQCGNVGTDADVCEIYLEEVLDEVA